MKMYAEILEQIKAVVLDERDAVANMANISSVIFNNLKDINWAGFYILKKDTLVLGPFQGRPACVRIKKGKGVCGACVNRKETIIVDDVHSFPGHIACDTASESELVVPIIKNGIFYGVLDIDSPVKKRFGPQEKYFFEKAAEFFKEYSEL